VALISVREYGKLHIGEFESARPSVTSAQAEVLTNLKPIYGFEVFKYVNSKTLSAQHYVGAFQFGPHTIEILPKIEGSSQNARHNLIGMLTVAIGVDISEGEAARLSTQSESILEILIRLFCDKLFIQVHRGLIRRYEGREENLSVLRGKLGIVEQIRLNAANPERLFCRFDEFQEDNSLNQILKSAIRTLLMVSRDLQNQRQLAELLLVFESASDLPKQSLPWDRVIFDRLSDRYRSCFKLAELFLKGIPPDVTGGLAHGFSMFFDMNVLFEEYVGRTAKRVFNQMGYRITLQGPQQYLAYDEENKRHTFAMKPDVVARLDSKIIWILDTKWKQLSVEEAKEGVVQSDLYQMFAYANCYDTTEVILLYPHHHNLDSAPGVRRTYSLNPWVNDPEKTNRHVKVATLDLTNLQTVPDQIVHILSA
jgi:5-methylcytosine-specific restriction enzyme subunit McrC